ncbi:MAG: hypothetical protein IJG15_02370, partial [Lachnospiraceae bacterium]|nr:hypothetical protein [Lachnospiraceae bacterium]
ARKSGSLRRFRRSENGEGSAELWAVSRHKALRAKNTVSTVFFTLAAKGTLSCQSDSSYIFYFVLCLLTFFIFFAAAG